MTNLYRERVTTFKKGLHVFWETEIMPTAESLIFMYIFSFLLWAAFFGICAAVTLAWLFVPAAKTHPFPLWIIYLDVTGLIAQVILVAVLFIRYVLHLGAREIHDDRCNRYKNAIFGGERFSRKLRGH
ncbi:hypothetical protein GGI1_06852 [Acidithiobacillus sp. GGI-221]|nr:hypothetical protein GGI1_06852 [Acidithiobacillus sp. GGI-221]